MLGTIVWSRREEPQNSQGLASEAPFRHLNAVGNLRLELPVEPSVMREMFPIGTIQKAATRHRWLPSAGNVASENELNFKLYLVLMNLNLTTRWLLAIIWNSTALSGQQS